MSQGSVIIKGKLEYETSLGYGLSVMDDEGEEIDVWVPIEDVIAVIDHDADDVFTLEITEALANLEGLNG